MPSVISPSDLNELRQFQQSLMEMEGKLIRPGTKAVGDLDEETGLEETRPSKTIWEGPCRLSTTRGPRPVTLGETEYIGQSTNAYLPWNAPMPLVDDFLEITSSPDPFLEGALFRVLDVERTQYLTARKLAIEHFQPENQTDGTET